MEDLKTGAHFFEKPILQITAIQNGICPQGRGQVNELISK